jgi:hypothetical protein
LLAVQTIKITSYNRIPQPFYHCDIGDLAYYQEGALKMALKGRNM